MVLLGMVNNTYSIETKPTNTMPFKKVINGKQYPYETMELTEDDRYDHDGYYRRLQASGAIIKSPPRKIREAYKTRK